MKPTNLELKHLAAYLPYELKLRNKWGDILTMTCSGVYGIGTLKQNTLKLKPILRPLSDLFDAAEEASGLEYIDLLMHFAECDVEIEFVDALKYEGRFKAMIKYAPYTLMQKLFEFHFDVFGLIDAGLAIDKNTLETN